MSENKSRSIQQIQQEYQNLCAKAGHLQYNLFVMQKDLSLVNETLKELNLEAASVQAQSAKAEAEQSKEEVKE